MSANQTAYDRRAFVSYFSSLGLGGTLLPGVLWAQQQQQPGLITKAMIAQAETVAGLTFTDAERESMAQGLNANLQSYQQLRSVDLPNSVVPAVQFDPVLPGMTIPLEKRPVRLGAPPRMTRPARIEDAAFLSVRGLGELLRTRQMSSVDLTTMYLARLKRFDEKLRFVVTLTEERALEKARAADREIAAGRYRGPLHGIPWGAKDLLATRGIRTTFGAKPYENQMLDYDATVVERLDAAGAVLVAKLTLGALAQGDQWYGGRTNNPWNPEQGASGSSAGPGSATGAGCVGFSIGTETLGSIVSPSTRNGVTGHRPTFGRVSRHGAMALSWTMDKIGPMCRSAEDCALVFAAIHGADGKDPTARDVPFNWDATRRITDLRIGYLKSGFEGEPANDQARSRRALDEATLNAMRGLGVRLIPIEMPAQYPLNAIRNCVLNAESAAAFDELTRSGRVNQIERSSWPASFRQARMIPAVEYIQANRVRTLVMRAMADVMQDIDVFVAPNTGNNVLVLTNLTGHPQVCVPNGFTGEPATPVSISFVGKLFGDADVLLVAKAFQDVTDFHKRKPPLFA